MGFDELSITKMVGVLEVEDSEKSFSIGFDSLDGNCHDVIADFLTTLGLIPEEEEEYKIWINVNIVKK